MSKQAKPSRKHHYVPQAQLRHFASDADRRSIWVYDKGLDRSWISSLLNAGSANDFNTVELTAGKWNFEDLFQDVDGRSARLVSEIVSRRALAWIKPEDQAAMVDLFATQMLRTKLARSTPHSMALQMWEMMRDIGVDPDADLNLATPTEAAIRIGAVKSFLKRDRVAKRWSGLSLRSSRPVPASASSSPTTPSPSAMPSHTATAVSNRTASWSSCPSPRSTRPARPARA